MIWLLLKYVIVFPINYLLKTLRWMFIPNSKKEMTIKKLKPKKRCVVNVAKK